MGGVACGGTAHTFRKDSSPKFHLSTDFGLGGAKPTRADSRSEDSEIGQQLGHGNRIDVLGDLTEFLVMRDALGDY